MLRAAGYAVYRYGACYTDPGAGAVPVVAAVPVHRQQAAPGQDDGAAGERPLPVERAWGVVGRVADPVAALTAGLASGLTFGLGARAWTRYTVFRLRVRGRLPWRLAGFLRRCQQAGLLRTAGPG
ncbi:hypothetical protein [Streptomyces yangpuensis]|uniref:hypothetical protein n=1 Tax=Streptomyces yangpuensis TaxID=1648182 RepID=UPI003721982E